MFGALRKAARPARNRRRSKFMPDEDRLGKCGACGSRLVQLRSWWERPDGRLQVETTCPECLREEAGEFEPREAPVWDEELARGREALESTYRALLRDNMVGELKALRAAFALDLVGADDWK